jgi:drug/metabolite transporter (DMT)-like permease
LWNILIDHLGKAIFSMLLSAVCFSLMGVMVRYAGDLPVVEKVFFRNFVTLIITSFLVAKHGRDLFRYRAHTPKIIARSLFGLIGVIAFFLAIQGLPLADATMLNKLSPFFVLLFASLFLRERLTGTMLLTLLGAFVGALLIIRPQFNLSVLPAVAGFASAICAGAAYTLVRSLKANETPHRIVFYFSLISTLALTPFLMMNFQMPTPAQWAALAGIGVFAAVGQYSLTYAYHQAPASRISIINYSGIIISLIAGLIFFAEMPDRLSLVGGLLIIAMAVINHLHLMSGAADGK